VDQKIDQRFDTVDWEKDQQFDKDQGSAKVEENLERVFQHMEKRLAESRTSFVIILIFALVVVVLLPGGQSHHTIRHQSNEDPRVT
jgi:anaerobic C4-dicarboxylate transporter